MVRAALATATSCLLAGCGGGGGDGAPAQGTTAASATPSPPAATGSASSGGTGATGGTSGAGGTATIPAADSTQTPRTSLQAAVLQVLQDERQRCGFSLLAASTALDSAAARHAAYLARDISNGVKGAHTETPGTDGFTGDTPLARAVAAGYPASAVNETFAHSSLASGSSTRASTPAPTDRVVSHTKFLLSTVYHMYTLLAPRRDLGVGYAEQEGSSAFTQVTVMELGIPSGSANLAQAEDLLTYPCDGTTAARASFVPSTETPNPLPGVGDAAVGTPIYLRAPAGKTLVLRSGSITGPDGAAVALTVLNAANDPVQWLTAAQVFVIPQQALTKGATYKVELAGTVDGTAFLRRFAFVPA